MSLYDIFLENTGKSCYKWNHYFPIYERYLAPFCNQSVTLIEIGVFYGGSLPVWKKFLGPLATIVGIDINEACKHFEEKDCHIRIGDQANPEFLKQVVLEFGPPDIVIDDGGHIQDQIMTTFSFLYPLLNNNSVYIVEDLHTSYWENYGGGLHNQGSFIEKCKGMVDMLNATYYMESDKVPWFTKNTWSIAFYDSMVVIEKKKHKPYYPIAVPPLPNNATKKD